MACESLGVGVATEVAKDLLYTTKREAGYFFCFNYIAKEQQIKLENLVRRHDQVLKCADDVEKKAEHIGDNDQRWIKEVGDLIEEAQKLEEKRKAKTKCFMGWSPNCIWQYRLGKKMAKWKEEATKRIDSSPFRKLQRYATLPNMEYYSSNDFVDLQSRNFTYNKLLEALEDEQISRIGLYGMGGIGKTTLVKQVGRNVEENNLFEKVVLVVVSISPDVKKIQDSIADSLGLRFQEQEELNRAKRLWLRLTKGEKILIILDNVWEKLDFEAIGIPCNESQKACKVLLTTRSVDVCYDMECQLVISLSLLSEEDAWILFQKYANISDESSQKKKDVAKKIAIKCKGLPVTIAALASTLKKSEFIQDWKVALESLENSEPLDDIDEYLKEVHKCLKLSYDNLKNEKAQSLFRLCSLFPEDHEISLEDLTRYGIGLGLFGNVHHKSYEFLRSQARKARKKLLDSCLLQQTEEEEFVIMHDLVRQVAHSITNRESQVIMGPEGELKALGDDARFQESVKLLWFDNMVEFPCQLDCPNLKILVINIEYGEQSLEVKDPFFREMKDLLVLTLTLKKIWYGHYKQISIPQSIQVLKNLRTLRLHNWILGDISILGSLKKLETLELEGCSFEELPTAMLELKKLRLLSLLACIVKKNPFVVMGRFLQLEELYFLGTGHSHWKIDGKNVSKFTDENCQWARLKRYQIEIGENFGPCAIVKETKITRALSVGCFDASTLNGTIKDLMRRAEFLYLEKVQGGYRSIMPDLVEADDGLNELIQLRLEGCLNIECLVDSASGSSPVGTIFSKLRKLEINLMDDLKELCQGHSPFNFFERLEELDLDECSQLHSILFVGNLKLCNLKVLKVRACPLLTSLFTLSIAQSLVLLEELSLLDCRELKYIIGYNAYLTNGENENIVVQKKDDYDREIMLPCLRILQLGKLPNYISMFPTKDHPVDQSLQLDNIGLEPTASTVQASKYKRSEQQLLPMPIAQCFPRQGLNLCHLKEMDVRFVRTLVSLFTPSTVQTMSLLETLTIYNCEGLKHIITNEEDESTVSGFPKLKKLRVEECNQLKFILPVSLSCGLVELRIVEVSECAVLKYVLGQYHDNDQNEDDIHIQIELPALEHLHLEELPIIINICPKNYSPIWPTLKTITLLECGHQLTLTSITDRCTKESEIVMTSNNNSQSVLNLEWLSVTECLDESIFQFKGVCTDGPHNPLTSRLGYLSLKNLPELWHICNGPMLLSFQNLTQLLVRQCGKLVTIFSVSVLRSLPQLCLLNINKCDQLEHIIEDKEEDQDWLNSSSHKECFPNLRSIVVEECSKLQYLFSICNPNELPKLEDLLIREACQLKQVFRCRMGNIEDRDKTLLPALQELTLVELPCLVNVCHGFKLQSQIELLRVVNCPQLPHEYQNAEEKESEDEFSEEQESEDAFSEEPKYTLASSEKQGSKKALSNGQEIHEAKEEGAVTVNERNVIKPSTGSAESEEAQTAVAQTSIVDPKTILTNSEEVTEAAPQTTKNEGHPSKFPINTTTELTCELTHQLNDGQNINTRVSPMKEENNKEAIKEEEDRKGDVLVESGEAHTAVEQATAPLIDATSSQSITPVVSMETNNAIHQNKIKLSSETVLNYRMEGKDTASITSTCDVPNKANEIALYLPKPKDPLEQDSKSEDDSNHVKYEVGYSGGVPVELLVEEYGAFRDIGAVKKRHIPLLEQAIANHPSLWAWSQEVKPPKLKHFGYIILGDLLEFLASTRWSDLNEAKKAEFESLVNGLEILRFDVQWLASTQSKIDKDTINHMKSLEVQVKSKESIMEYLEVSLQDMKSKLSLEVQVKSKESIVKYLEVSLQDAKAELYKMKSELDTLRTKLGNINDFIGF